MFFTDYDPLTAQYVEEAAAKRVRPDGEHSACLAGLSFTARLDGEYAPAQLAYEFLDGETLRVTENGTAYTAPYAAIELGRLVVCTHLIPGSSRGFHFILDTESYALTVFETWFGITVPVGFDMTGKNPPKAYRDIPREVQRQYSFGWADDGKHAEPRKHTTTNRMEGRGLHWAFDTGYEMLSFSPSVICSTVVELGQEKGGITMSDPTDYLRIDDRYYVFARWEVEFGGKMWLEVLDYFDMKAAGVELGFEKDDTLTHRTHRANLTVTGDAAHLEKITDLGDDGKPFARMRPGKGARYTYRPMDIDVPMPREEAYYHARRAQRILADPSENYMQSFYCLPRSKALVGKSFRVVPDRAKYAAAPWNGKDRDETAWSYEILSENRLRWRLGDGEWKEEKYACFEVDPELFFLGHMVTDAEDFATVAQAIDFRTGLTTTVRTGIGNWRSEWEAGANVAFGTLDAEGVTPPFARRHHFTDELVGCTFAWDYSPTMYSIHTYSAPESLSWTIFMDNNGGGATWSSPGFYIKLRDGVYILNWIEERCNGSQGLVVINRKIQHDSGFFYGVTHDGLRLETTGAYMRDLGHFDIKKYI